MSLHLPLFDVTGYNIDFKSLLFHVSGGDMGQIQI